MRKAVLIVGAIVGVVLVLVGAILFYAAENLDSIIAERRAYLLTRVSDSLGRKVEVAEIKATIGWGVTAELTNVKIADDPAISDRPFVEASNAYARVELMPLLSRKVHVTELTLANPEVRIVRTAQGTLNVSSIGKKSTETRAEAPQPAAKKGPVEGVPLTSQAPPGKGGSSLGAISVNNFSIEKGQIVYQERGPHPQTVTIKDVDLTVKDFSFERTFDIALSLAMFSDRQNIDISGTAGPLATNGAINMKAFAFKIKAKLGPLELARLRAISAIGKSIPEKLSIPDPVSVEAQASGNLDTTTFHVESDLSSDRVGWGDSFLKPASQTLKISASGSRSSAGLQIAEAKVKLGELDATAKRISFGGGNLRARVDTNRFDVASLGKMVPALQKYNASGQIEIHSDVSVVNKEPRATGTLTLNKVSVSRPEDKKTLVDNLTGDIRLQGAGAEAGPLNFDVASSHAMLTFHATSLQPLNANYNLSVAAIKLADFVPTRPPEENLKNLAANGTVSQAGALAVSAKLTSSEGNLANIAFKDLNMAATVAGQQINLQSLRLSAFNGTVATNGRATLGAEPQFALALVANGIDIQQALQSQQSKAADMIRGTLDGQVQVSGRGSKFDQIKPTLVGTGRAVVKNGKLIGVNVAAEALNKTKGLPAIGDLVPASMVQRHPELFNNPDTDIQAASLSFALQGPKITTHDLTVQTPDYGLTGDGWFDMDKSIEMSAHILLTKQLTDEIVAEKHNVVYVTNRAGQVDIPLVIRGKLPKPAVLPDIGELAQRAGSHAIEQQGQAAISKFLGKKGKGIPFLPNGGGSGGNAGGNAAGNAPAGSNTPSTNPLDQLKQFKGLFR